MAPVRMDLRAGVRAPILVGAVAATTAGYLAAVDPNQRGHYPTCPFFLLTGRYCPGCGGLRAVHDLLHGQLSAALSANLLVILGLPVVLLLWADWVIVRLTGTPSRIRIPAWSAWAFLVVVLVFWGLRNLSETSWLAP